MSNRLGASTSPYLRQHQDNPVDWFEWGDEAFAAARERDVPVFLSIGYAACHWCHVMAHESFEDAVTADYLNAHFVSVKVDREERPDVDAVYMEATQAMTGHGGWPMSVFMTADGEPFFTGTYFPPAPAHGMPSFRQLLASVTDAWQQRRAEVVAAGQRIVSALTENRQLPAGSGPPTDDELAVAVRGLASAYDEERGGFGGAPKFPPSMVLELLLRHHARTGDPASLAMVEGTCSAMARGGMYDQLGGGFARYSVDTRWVVPHFEKMLYDNALLLRVYTHLWRATGSVLARRVALETAEWLLRDLRTAEGGFASALDADSEGVEGKFYVWTPDEVGPDAARMFSVGAAGTFEHGTSVLQLLDDPDDAELWRTERARLLGVRERRVPPARDDKVVAAWNGLGVAALAETGALLDRPDLVEAAVEAAELLVAVHLDGGRLRRVSRDGVAGAPAGVLEDYADVAEGFLALYAVTGAETWLDHAGGLLDVVLARFPDGAGGFYDTPDDGERLVRRPADPTDSAAPAGRSAAAGALLTYAAYTGSSPHRAAAEGALSVYGPLAAQHARFAGWGLAVAEALLDGPREVAVVGPSGDERTIALHAAALMGTAPGAAVAIGDPGAAPRVPLLQHRPMVGGSPAAYVCRHFACDAPTTDPAALATALRSR